MLLEQQISISEWFLKDHETKTWKIGVMMLKIQLCHQRNKLYSKRKFHNITVSFNQINAALVCRRDFFNLSLNGVVYIYILAYKWQILSFIYTYNNMYNTLKKMINWIYNFF